MFLKAGEVQHRLSMQFVSGHAIPDALHRLRNRPPNRGAYLFTSPTLTAQQCTRQPISERFFSYSSFYVSACGFSSPLSVWRQFLRRYLPHCQRLGRRSLDESSATVPCAVRRATGRVNIASCALPVKYGVGSDQTDRTARTKRFTRLSRNAPIKAGRKPFILKPGTPLVICGRHSHRSASEKHSSRIFAIIGRRRS